MAKRDIVNFDASDRAASELEYVLKKDTKAEAAPRISVAEAISQPRVFQMDSTRTTTRVLFVSQDASLLNPEKQSLDGFLNLHELFQEVHVLILRQGIEAKNPVFRVARNVWLYTASSRYWWAIPSAGIKLVEEQMVFAAGFRPLPKPARIPRFVGLLPLLWGCPRL